MVTPSISGRQTSAITKSGRMASISGKASSALLATPMIFTRSMLRQSGTSLKISSESSTRNIRTGASCRAAFVVTARILLERQILESGKSFSKLRSTYGYFEA
jgi:hypothetical protein